MKCGFKMNLYEIHLSNTLICYFFYLTTLLPAQDHVASSNRIINDNELKGVPEFSWSD